MNKETEQRLREKFYKEYKDKRMGNFSHPDHWVADYWLSKMKEEIEKAVLKGERRRIIESLREEIKEEMAKKINKKINL